MSNSVLLNLPKTERDIGGTHIATMCCNLFAEIGLSKNHCTGSPKRVIRKQRGASSMSLSALPGSAGPHRELPPCLSTSWPTLDGSFSAVSTATIARKDAF